MGHEVRKYLFQISNRVLQQFLEIVSSLMKHRSCRMCISGLTWTSWDIMLNIKKPGYPQTMNIQEIFHFLTFLTLVHYLHLLKHYKLCLQNFMKFRVGTWKTSNPKNLCLYHRLHFENLFSSSGFIISLSCFWDYKTNTYLHWYNFLKSQTYSQQNLHLRYLLALSKMTDLW